MSEIVVSDLSMTSLETIMAFDINGGLHRFTLDELQNANIGNSQENEPLIGRAGRTIGQLKRNKSVTVSGTNGMISTGLLEVEVGSAGEHKVTTVKVPNYLTVSGNTATTLYTAVGTVGNEIGEVIVKNSDSTIAKRLTQDATASIGKFAYDPATKTLTFADGEIADGTNIVVYYFRRLEADVISNISDKLSEMVEVYIDGFAEDKCHNIFHVQYFMPYADFTGNFDIALGDTQAVHNFEFTSLPQTCGDGSTKFWDMTIFNKEAEDVAA